MPIKRWQLSFDDLFAGASDSVPIIPPMPPPLTEPSSLIPDDDVSYLLERSARRTQTVQISVLPDLTVRVVAPMRLPKSRVDAFVGSRKAWISERRAQLRKAQAMRNQRRWVTGETLPYLDENLELRVTRVSGRKGLTCARAQQHLEVTTPCDLESTEPIRQLVEKWYARDARRTFAQRILHYAPMLDVMPTNVLVRNQETRWGSCASDGTLRFCWRLVLAPLRIFDYVVVHELSHLRHHHHQPPFWECVGSILPNYQDLRAELRREGESYRL